MSILFYNIFFLTRDKSIDDYQEIFKKTNDLIKKVKIFNKILVQIKDPEKTPELIIQDFPEIKNQEVNFPELPEFVPIVEKAEEPTQPKAVSEVCKRKSEFLTSLRKKYGGEIIALLLLIGVGVGYFYNKYLKAPINPAGISSTSEKPIDIKKERIKYYKEQLRKIAERIRPTLLALPNSNTVGFFVECNFNELSSIDELFITKIYLSFEFNFSNGVKINRILTLEEVMNREDKLILMSPNDLDDKEKERTRGAELKDYVFELRLEDTDLSLSFSH